MIRKPIKPGTRLAVKLSTRERDLVVERALLDPEIEAELRRAVPSGTKLLINLNLDDIGDLRECVAAEANHRDDGRVQGVLDAFGDRLSALLEQYTDDPPGEPVATGPPTARFTAKQGQYLAFIHNYTKVHRVPPAEADLQRYFRVSPPAVHAMILVLQHRLHGWRAGEGPDAVTYIVFEHGRHEVFMQPFGRPGERIRVSPDGGGQPRWRADGRELYYVTPTGAVMAVTVGPDGELGSAHQRLFDISAAAPYLDQYASSRDGQRFLVMLPVPTGLSPVRIVSGWRIDSRTRSSTGTR